MRNARLTVVAVLALFVAAPASAQQTATPQATPAPQAAPSTSQPAPDAKTLEAAKELVKLMNISRNLSAMFDVETKTIIPLIQRANPTENSAKFQGIVASVMQDMKKSYMDHMDGIEANYATVYAQEYSYDDLQQIMAFYKSPAGQKMLNSTPEIAQKAAVLNQGIIVQAMKECMQKMHERLQQNGLNVPQGL